MNRNFFSILSILVLALFAAAVSRSARADEKADRAIVVADGHVQFTAPDAWKREKPRVNFIEHEFSVPPAEGDETPGRVTVMGAGGTIEANVDRWLAQFDQPDGSETKDRAKTEKKKIAGRDVLLLDVSGTYKDSPGPFAGGKVVERPGYRMLAAIVKIDKHGNYFIKLYGPEKTITAAAEGFHKMIDEMKSK